MTPPLPEPWRIVSRIDLFAKPTNAEGIRVAYVAFPEVKEFMASVFGEPPRELWGVKYEPGTKPSWHNDGGEVAVYFPADHDSRIEFRTKRHDIPTRAQHVHRFPGAEAHRVSAIGETARYAVCGRYV